MLKDVSKSVDRLSDALNALDDFEKFMVNFLNGKYSALPDIKSLSAGERNSLTAEFDQTKAALVNQIIFMVRELNGTP